MRRTIVKDLAHAFESIKTRVLERMGRGNEPVGSCAMCERRVLGRERSRGRTVEQFSFALKQLKAQSLEFKRTFYSSFRCPNLVLNFFELFKLKTSNKV